MGSVTVKNTLTRQKARLYRRELRKHMQGLFLRVGNKKIPVGKVAVVDDTFREQINFLREYGALEILNVNAAPPNPGPKVIDSMKRTKHMAEQAKVPVASGSDIDADLDDFVIITSEDNKDIFDDLPAKNVKFVEEKKSIPKSTKKEVTKEETKKGTPVVVTEEKTEVIVEESILEESPSKKEGSPIAGGVQLSEGREREDKHEDRRRNGREIVLNEETTAFEYAEKEEKQAEEEETEISFSASDNFTVGEEHFCQRKNKDIADEECEKLQRSWKSKCEGCSRFKE